MNPVRHIAALLAALLCLTAGCGGDLDSISMVSASLLIPRDLADELTDVTIFVIETNKETHQPDCPTLRSAPDAYKSANVVQKEKVAFDPRGTSVLISGIPDRGRVWRFYAQGYNNDLLIAEACEDGLRDVPARDTITVTLTLERI